MDLFRKKLAVLDLTHGGIPIAKKLAALGNDVSGVDVYGTVDQALLGELEEKYGIRCSKTPLPVSEFDLLIAPVHLDPAYPMLSEARSEGKTVLSHHEAIGKILQDDPELSDIRIVEVTGVKAKTSTASLLADMLSRRFEVVLHTSRGLEAWKEGVPFLIHRGLSITPGSILTAIEKSLEAGIRPEFFIFEISIGGTGTADLGILTTLSPDYGIANNTSLASDAKLQLILNAKPGSTLLLNAGAEKALEAAKGSQAKVLTFKDPFYADSHVKMSEVPDFVLETEDGLQNRQLLKNHQLPQNHQLSQNRQSLPNLQALPCIFSAEGKKFFQLPCAPDITVRHTGQPLLQPLQPLSNLGLSEKLLFRCLRSSGGFQAGCRKKSLMGLP